MTTPHEKAQVILDMLPSILLTKVQTDPDWAAGLLREFAAELLPPLPLSVEDRHTRLREFAEALIVPPTPT